MKEAFRLKGQYVMLVAVASAYPVAGYGATAAQVDFTVGNVTATNANGKSRTITKGAQIEQGETINTNKGRAHLRFTDGAYVSLQPESQFRIDQYNYSGKTDGTERGFFSLLKGGLRTVTGLVGRSNKQNYQVTTSVATIGIRGTEYTIQYGQSVTGTVGEGEIAVCNGAGCLSVMNGESYYVQTQSIKPVLTNKRTDLPPPPPQNPPQEFVEAEQVNSEGDPCVLFPSTCVASTGLDGTFSARIGAAHTYFNGTGGTTMDSYAYSGTATFSNGKLVSMTDNGGSGIMTPGTTGTVDAGSDSIIAWGRLINGQLGGTPATGGDHAGGILSNGESFHYVVGLPAAALPTSGTVNYSTLAATAPTFSSGSGMIATLGTFHDMTVAANFSAGVSTFALKVEDPSHNIYATNGSFGVGSTFSGSGTATNCSGNCVFVSGFFAGANAERMGISYLLTPASCGGFTCKGVGVVALQRN